MTRHAILIALVGMLFGQPLLAVSGTEQDYQAARKKFSAELANAQTRGIGIVHDFATGNFRYEDRIWRCKIPTQ